MRRLPCYGAVRWSILRFCPIWNRLVRFMADLLSKNDRFQPVFRLTASMCLQRGPFIFQRIWGAK